MEICLPKEEVFRMKERTRTLSNDRKTAMKSRDPLSLKKQSEEMSKNWPNTLAKQHEKRLLFKKLKEERLEEERKKEDEEERMYQAQVRADAIDKANRMHFNALDEVKQFHSALLSMDMVQDRQKQVTEGQKAADTSDELQTGHGFCNAIFDNEQLRIEREKRNKQDTVAFQLQQAEEKAKMKDETKRKELLEGEEARRQSEKCEEEKKKLRLATEKRKQELRKAQFDAMVIKEENRLRCLALQQKEDQTMKSYEISKLAASETMRTKEEQRSKLRKEAREKVQEKWAEVCKSDADKKAEQCCEEVAEEMRRKHEEELLATKQRQKQDFVDLARNWSNQVEVRKKMLEESENAKRDEAAKQQEEISNFRTEAERKRREKLMQNIDYRKCLLEQMKLKDESAKKDKAREEEEDRKRMEQLASQRNEFKKYVKETLEERDAASKASAIKISKIDGQRPGKRVQYDAKVKQSSIFETST